MSNFSEIPTLSELEEYLRLPQSMLVPFMVALQNKELSHRTQRPANFAFLAIICFLVFALEIPSG
jgi:hypothetical protein